MARYTFNLPDIGEASPKRKSWRGMSNRATAWMRTAVWLT